MATIMKKKLKVIGTCTLMLAFLLSPIQHSYSADFIPLTVVSSQKWNGVVGDSNSLGKTIIMARNDSSFTLGNVQAMVSYFDEKGKLIETANTYGAMLSRVAPGETIGIFDIFTNQPSTYSVRLVAGIPTSTPANRNIRIDSVSWGTTDAEGYKFLRVQVTNLNKTVAESVRFMANCGNFGGPYVFDGPTFPSSLEPGATETLYKIYGPKNPPCNNIPTVIGDATSAPSAEVFPLNYVSAADKAAADKIAADKAVADKIAADKAAAVASAKAAADAILIDVSNELVEALNSADAATMKLVEIDDQLAATTRDSSAMLEQLNQRIGQLITDLQKMIKELSEIVKKMSKKLGG
jgi:hypothetical protein